jgi:hypothetical protein
LLTTDCAITEIKTEKENFNPQQMGMGYWQ